MNVVELKHVRDWKSVAGAIKQMLLGEIDLPEELADRFIVEFQPVYQSMQFEFSFSVPSEAQLVMQAELKTFEHELKEFTLNLFLERLKREIEIFKEKYETVL